MAEYSAIAVQTVNPGETIVFTETTSPCKRGFVRHSDGSGNFLLNGWVPNNNCCCGCNNDVSAVYLVDFGANIAIPTDGTPAVPIEAMTAVKITVKRAEIPKSIPYAWAANITAHPCMMAVPSMLMVAPNGIVNDETSRETPSSESFSRFSGIVAFDVEDENAKNITEMNFLKNLIGFNLVKTTSKDGYTSNA